jgi:hypothetical protein
MTDPEVIAEICTARGLTERQSRFICTWIKRKALSAVQAHPAASISRER